MFLDAPICMLVLDLIASVTWKCAGLLIGAHAQSDACPPGLPGPGCSACTTNEQCVQSLGNSVATCSDSFAFANTSTIKAYQCNPSGPPLIVNLLEPNSVKVQCFTGFKGDNAVPAVDGSSSSSLEQGLFGRRRRLQQEEDKYCYIAFNINDPRIGVECDATACSMTPGGKNVVCDKIVCSCSDNGQCNNDVLIDNIVKSANDRVTWECEDNGTCILGLAGFVVPRIETQCITGECLVPSTSSIDQSEVIVPPSELEQPVDNLRLNGFIASIPTIVLTIVIGFVGYHSYGMKEYWKSGFSCSGPVGGTVKSEKAMVDTFEFHKLAVYVPMSEQVAELKRHSLRGKALVRHGTMHTFSSPNHGVTHSVVKKAKKKLGLKTSDDVEVPEEFNRVPKNNYTDAAQKVVELHDGRHKGEWCVLKDCNGVINAGQVVGILGPSGCGKTTLLSSITGSAIDLGSSAVLEGSVLINGEPCKAHQVAYVPQTDCLIPTLTVRECIKYSALLRLPTETSPDEINIRVENVLIELGIQHLGDSQVGGSGKIRGVSGGERRRVTIAMELVTDPSIIVLDEPTSGLDSYTAMTLARCLRQVAAAGRVVIASLHQPSKDMYFGLDTVILMGHGRILYMGKPEEASQFMTDAGVPPGRNTPTAEHMLQVASNPESVIAMLRAKHVRDKSAVKNSSIGSPGKIKFQGREAPAVEDLAGCQTSEEPSPTADTVSVDDGVPEERVAQKSRTEHDVRRELSVMFWRTLVDIIRNPTLLTLHVVLSTCTGVVTGAIFYELDDTSVGVQNRMGGTFFALAFLAFTSLTTVDLLMNERTVVMREVRSKFYRPSSYLISKIALDGMLLRVIPAILYWLPFYYMAGFQYGSAYAASYLFILISFNCAVGALSMVVTIACNTAGQTSFIMNFILLFSLAFTGFLVNVNSIPAVLRWIHYLSVFFYAFESMMSTELKGQSFTFLYQSGPTSETLEIPDISGETFLTTLGFNCDDTTRDIGVLVGVYYGFAVLALLFFLMRLPRTNSALRTTLRHFWARVQAKSAKVFNHSSHT